MKFDRRAAQWHRGRDLWFVLSFVIAAVSGAGAEAATPSSIRGLPFTRFYSLDEIGNIAAGPRLSFDPLGRLAVIHEGAYVVLNDTVWLDMTDKSASGPAMLQVIADRDGQLYYGAFGSWGTVEVTASGKLRPQPLVPSSYPAWVTTSNFVDIILTRSGVYFSGWNGVIYWDRATKQHQFFNAPGITNLFSLGERIFIFSHSGQVQYVDPVHGSLVSVAGSPLEDTFIDQTTTLDENHVLVATGDRRLLVFDGQTFAPWENILGPRMSGRITSLARLVDGSIALAISGKGLYVISPEGDILSSLTDTEHYRITGLAAHEPGVLWVATESGVEKVLYRSPVSVFGQRIGLPISWPQVARWHDRVVVASGGRLYEARADSSGETARFQPAPGQPASQIWAIASNGAQMIVGDNEALFSRNDDGSFERIMARKDISRLVMVSPDFCYFLGTSEIGALRWANGRWSECAPRVPGVGYPAITHAAGHSAWIELGGNRAARVSFRDGQLHVRVFDQFPWKEPRWINVGVVGDTVVLAGPPSGRIYFDEKTERFVDAPQLQRLFDVAPYWITRLQQDETGTLWATHDRGVFTMRRNGNSYDVDPTTFDIINDSHPNIQLLPDGDVWLSTGQSLYHVDRHSAPPPSPQLKPILVAVSHGEAKSGLYRGDTESAASLFFPYAENNLSFRFFSRSYASRRPPGYEFRLNDAPGGWTSLGTASLLTLPNLREGKYHLDVRLAEAPGAASAPLSIDFEIGQPWYRSWYAYTGYWLGAALAALGLLRWFVHRASVRNLELAQLVEERTSQLKVAMEKLNDETRNAATLAERNRLAGEIHDSVQQGLSGIMLQLDATLKMPAITEAVRSRLDVARKMISFTRHEVQHAVWNMESPLLEANDLGEALKKIAGLVSPGAARMTINVSGPPSALSSSTKHHLLRIAQEAIANAVRHAAPTSIDIVLAHETDGLSLTITDDGCGFRPEEVLANAFGHFGLRGMRDRASKVGGVLEIHSAPKEGTSIRITVPAVVPAGTQSHATSR